MLLKDILINLADINTAKMPTQESAQHFYNFIMSRDCWIVEPEDRLNLFFTIGVVAVSLNSYPIFKDMLQRLAEPMTEKESQVIEKLVNSSRGSR